jgi:hypothetical protein
VIEGRAFARARPNLGDVFVPQKSVATLGQPFWRAVWRALPPGAKRRVLREQRRFWKGVTCTGVASLLEMVGFRMLHCLGDSHAQVFEQIRRDRLLRGTFIDVTQVGGATALGLANPNSRTAAFPTFQKSLQRIPAHHPVLFMMGEVDCGFLLWLRAETKGGDVEDELETSFRNYTSFLDGVLGSRTGRLIVTAVPPPTILDGQTWGEVADARKEVRASIVDRTRLTVRYNERLRRWTAERSVAFLDFESDVLDPDTGLVRSSLRNPDPLDHHLSPQGFAPLLARHLRECLIP